MFVAGFPRRQPGFQPTSVHVGLVVDKVVLRQVSSQYFGFLCQFSFHRLLHVHHHLSSGAATVVADVPHPKKLKKAELLALEKDWNSQSQVQKYERNPQ
jgi:hypothetical protein